MVSAAAVRARACQRAVDPSCRPVNPSVFKTATSCRRRLTEVTSECARAPAAMTANRAMRRDCRRAHPPVGHDLSRPLGTHNAELTRAFPHEPVQLTPELGLEHSQ